MSMDSFFSLTLLLRDVIDLRICWHVETGFQHIDFTFSIELKESVADDPVLYESFIGSEKKLPNNAITYGLREF